MSNYLRLDPQNIHLVKFLICSAVLCVIATTMHSCEVHSKAPLAAHDLDTKKETPSKINFTLENTGKVRVTAKYSNLCSGMSSSTEVYFEFFQNEELIYRTTRTTIVGSGGSRSGEFCSSHLNYGLFKLEKSGTFLLKANPGKKVRSFRSYQIRITDNPNRSYEFIQIVSLGFLLLSFYRKEYRVKLKIEVNLEYSLRKFMLRFLYGFFVIVIFLMNIGL